MSPGRDQFPVASLVTALHVSLTDIADIALVGTILLISLFTFTCNDLFAYLSTSLAFIPGGIWLLLLCAIIVTVILGRFAGTGTGNVVCLSWLLFIPSVLSFSRLDLLSIIVPGGFGSFTGTLTAPAIIISGVVLAGCTLAHGTVAEMRALRSDLIGRGADPAEVEAALRKNMLPLVVTLFAALVLSSAVAATAALLVPLALRMEYTGPLHLVFLAAGTLLFALLIVAYLWSKRA